MPGFIRGWWHALTAPGFQVLDLVPLYRVPPSTLQSNRTHCRGVPQDLASTMVPLVEDVPGGPCNWNVRTSKPPYKTRFFICEQAGDKRTQTSMGGGCPSASAEGRSCSPGFPRLGLCLPLAKCGIHAALSPSGRAWHLGAGVGVALGRGMASGS